ncbi:reverse transcriptase [Penicillium argentinense]|uniref:Reverse transcriptase n=1 Tax=Penicillium argentinense TaxID=1131581 RepID=A0A9W9FH92_9EURO|nr:reverse transcriptase [Penicillium argentinense]KAJ5100114.1 reverse transcriptase [Penicillium argentinense]
MQTRQEQGPQDRDSDSTQAGAGEQHPSPAERQASKASSGRAYCSRGTNAHNPAWGGPETKIDDKAEQLLQITDEQELELITEERKATWTRNDQSSVIDLTFISPSLSGRIIRCGRADDIEHSSDRFPIRTTLDMETPILTQQRRRNWKATDDGKLIQKIEEGLRERDLPMVGHRQIEEQCQKLLGVVQCAIDFQLRGQTHRYGRTPTLTKSAGPPSKRFGDYDEYTRGQKPPTTGCCIQDTQQKDTSGHKSTFPSTSTPGPTGHRRWTSGHVAPRQMGQES